MAETEISMFLPFILGKIYPVLLLVASGLLLRLTLLVVGQNWVSSFAHTMTFAMLPVITYIITSVISGNIALSLGMVGALSIVRFRNPVKSPLELVVYFLLLTLGIASSVHLMWALLLLLSALFIILLLHIWNAISLRLLGRPYYGVSFSEGIALSVLEVESTEHNPTLINARNLVNFTQNDGVSIYRLASSSPNEMRRLADTLRDDPLVRAIRLTLH
jgi:Domain of unknown function (DUF4956)